MRLQQYEINAIKSLTRDIFREDCKVILFGSRVYDDITGWDIDLYLQTSDYVKVAEHKINYLVALKLALGDQKIDLVIAQDQSRSIEQEAIKNGIEL
ncbi:MAG: nucleotidyltransferase domain-containing protein [Chlorobiaceae bacterium]